MLALSGAVSAHVVYRVCLLPLVVVVVSAVHEQGLHGDEVLEHPRQTRVVAAEQVRDAGVLAADSVRT